MSNATTGSPIATDASNNSRYRPLRVWPLLILVVTAIVLRLLPSLIENGPANLWMAAAFGPVLCCLLMLAWWVSFSRASWQERLVGFLGIIAAGALSLAIAHASMLGPAALVLTIPVGSLAFALGAFLFARTLSFKRTIIAILMACVGFGFAALLRNDGMWGDFSMGFDWRWNPTAEERLVADKADQSTATTTPPQEAMRAAIANPEWPGFRGSDRTGHQTGSRVATDWKAQPPELLWKIRVGPAWSSFAVAGNYLFTQEQRGPMECVVCYLADSGKELWVQQFEDRFEEAIGGPGPRATPTIHDGSLFVLGANGELMRLDAITGDVQWQQDIKQVANRPKPPTWGFSSSPLVVGSVVIVHVGGHQDKGTLAFDADSGVLRWSAAAGDHSYSSPQLCTVLDQQAVVVLTNQGVDLLDPETGESRLTYEWKHEGYRALQPQVIDGNSILLPTGMGAGTRRIRVTDDGNGWSAETLWTSRNLKPDFNDYVVYQDHIYGFDNSLFTCVELATGDRKWKGGRYGKGQVLLLADVGLLLVASEKGEAILLQATPEKKMELAKTQAIEGKTWNHPVVIGDRLYIRNGEEAACYRLPIAADPESESTTH